MGVEKWDNFNAVLPLRLSWPGYVVIDEARRLREIEHFDLGFEAEAKSALPMSGTLRVSGWQRGRGDAWAPAEFEMQRLDSIKWAGRPALVA